MCCRCCWLTAATSAAACSRAATPSFTSCNALLCCGPALIAASATPCEAASAHTNCSRVTEASTRAEPVRLSTPPCTADRANLALKDASCAALTPEPLKSRSRMSGQLPRSSATLGVTCVYARCQDRIFVLHGMPAQHGQHPQIQGYTSFGLDNKCKALMGAVLSTACLHCPCLLTAGGLQASCCCCGRPSVCCVHPPRLATGRLFGDAGTVPSISCLYASANKLKLDLWWSTATSLHMPTSCSYLGHCSWVDSSGAPKGASAAPVPAVCAVCPCCR